MDEVNKLLDVLKAVAAPKVCDAIDAELSRPARVTATQPIDAHPAIEAFRNEVTDALIRADAVRQLLTLAVTVANAVLK